MSGDVFIAVCTLGNVRAEWAVGLASMHQLTGRVQQLSLIRNMGIADARNFAVNLACSMDCDYLVFWDDDIIPKLSDSHKRLVTALDQNPEIDVVGAVYPMRRAVSEPCVVQEKDHGVYWGWRDEKLHEVYMTGTGFMAIRLESLKKTVPEPYPLANVQLGKYFWIEEDGQGGTTTDDFWFAAYCKHWGLKQYVHGGVMCDQIEITGETVRIEEAMVAVA